MKTFFALTLCALICATTACKRKVSFAGGTAEQDGDTVTIKTADGGTYVAGGDVELPDGFPDDIPQPSKDIEMAMKMPQGISVGFKCDGTPGQWFKEMKKKMTDQGWEEVMSLQQSQGGTMSFKKDEKRTVQCTIGDAQDGKTMVNMMIMERP